MTLHQNNPGEWVTETTWYQTKYNMVSDKRLQNVVVVFLFLGVQLELTITPATTDLVSEDKKYSTAVSSPTGLNVDVMLDGGSEHV